MASTSGALGASLRDIPVPGRDSTLANEYLITLQQVDLLLHTTPQLDYGLGLLERTKARRLSGSGAAASSGRQTGPQASTVTAQPATLNPAPKSVEADMITKAPTTMPVATVVPTPAAPRIQLAAPATTAPAVPSQTCKAATEATAAHDPVPTPSPQDSAIVPAPTGPIPIPILTTTSTAHTPLPASVPIAVFPVVAVATSLPPPLRLATDLDLQAPDTSSQDSPISPAARQALRSLSLSTRASVATGSSHLHANLKTQNAVPVSPGPKPYRIVDLHSDDEEEDQNAAAIRAQREDFITAVKRLRDATPPTASPTRKASTRRWRGVAGKSGDDEVPSDQKASGKASGKGRVAGQVVGELSPRPTSSASSSDWDADREADDARIALAKLRGLPVPKLVRKAAAARAKQPALSPVPGLAHLHEQDAAHPAMQVEIMRSTDADSYMDAVGHDEAEVHGERRARATPGGAGRRARRPGYVVYDVCDMLPHEVLKTDIQAYRVEDDPVPHATEDVPAAAQCVSEVTEHPQHMEEMEKHVEEDRVLDWRVGMQRENVVVHRSPADSSEDENPYVWLNKAATMRDPLAALPTSNSDDDGHSTRMLRTVAAVGDSLLRRDGPLGHLTALEAEVQLHAAEALLLTRSLTGRGRARTGKGVGSTGVYGNSSPHRMAGVVVRPRGMGRSKARDQTGSRPSPPGQASTASTSRSGAMKHKEVAEHMDVNSHCDQEPMRQQLAPPAPPPAMPQPSNSNCTVVQPLYGGAVPAAVQLPVVAERVPFTPTASMMPAAPAPAPPAGNQLAALRLALQQLTVALTALHDDPIPLDHNAIQPGMLPSTQYPIAAWQPDDQPTAAAAYPSGLPAWPTPAGAAVGNAGSHLLTAAWSTGPCTTGTSSVHTTQPTYLSQPQSTLSTGDSIGHTMDTTSSHRPLHGYEGSTLPPRPPQAYGPGRLSMLSTGSSGSQHLRQPSLNGLRQPPSPTGYDTPQPTASQTRVNYQAPAHLYQADSADNQTAGLTPRMPAVHDGSLASLTPGANNTHAMAQDPAWDAHVGVMTGHGVFPVAGGQFTPQDLAMITRFSGGSSTPSTPIVALPSAPGSVWSLQLQPSGVLQVMQQSIATNNAPRSLDSSQVLVQSPSGLRLDLSQGRLRSLTGY